MKLPHERVSAVRAQVHTPNLNHIGLWVDHLDACVEWLKANGVRFAGLCLIGFRY
jgi:hypothetical protein